MHASTPADSSLAALVPSDVDTGRPAMARPSGGRTAAAASPGVVDPGSPVFLSAAWREAWLGTLPPSCRVERWALPGVPGGVPVGRSDLRRFGVTLSRRLALNETGDRRYDIVMVEYNGIAGMAEPVGACCHDESRILALLDTLSRRRDWDELVVGGMLARPARRLAEMARKAGFGVNWRTVEPTYVVDLDAVRAAGGDYLALLGSKTRAELRKARRALVDAAGPLRIEHAPDADTAGRWFDELRDLHERRWTARGSPGGVFREPYFETFHRALIQRSFAQGIVRLTRISAGGNTVGVLHTLRFGDRIYGSLCGFNYDAFPAKARVGIVSHLLTIEDGLADPTLRFYDFLAGRADYKEHMATHRDAMAWFAIQRPGLRTRLGNLARERVQRWRGLPPVELSLLDEAEVVMRGKA